MLGERFWGKVKKTDGCWEWQAGKYSGYGYYQLNKKSLLAHRLAYEELVGALPLKASGLQIDHLCRNRACVNPKHLEIVTIKENVLRGSGISAVNYRKTHCKRGHEFTPDNIYVRPKGRECRLCWKTSKQLQN